jgi:ariadne-1
MTYSDSEESYNSYDDDDNEDYFSSVDDEGDECSDGVDDDDGMDEDESCQSDGDDDDCGDVGGDVVSDDDDDMPQAAERNDKGYVFETEADVRKRQDEVTASVSELLSIPWGLAAVFLRHCRWDAERLENEWFSDERRIHEAVGLAADQGDAATAFNDRPLTCAICFDVHSAGAMISAGCAHYVLLPRVLGRLHPRGGGRRRAVPGAAVPGPELRRARDAGAGARGRRRLRG